MTTLFGQRSGHIYLFSDICKSENKNKRKSYTSINDFNVTFLFYKVEFGLKNIE